MDPLEKYIKDHKAELDVYDTPPLLWTKIEHSLPQRDDDRRILYLITRIAAVLVLVLVAGFGVGYFLGNKHNANIKDTAMATELKQTEDYYKIQVSSRLQKMDAIPIDKTQLMTELSELETTYEDLRNQLSVIPDSNKEFVISKMIQNYQKRIMLLEIILNKSANQNKIYQNEESIKI